MREALARLGVALLFVAAATIPAAGATGATEGPGWILLRVSSSAPFNLTLAATANDTSQRAGYVIAADFYDSLGAHLLRASVVEVDGGTWFVASETGARVSRDVFGSGHSNGTLKILVPTTSGADRVLLWGAGSLRSFRFSADGDSVVTELARGSGAFYSDGSDFEGEQVHLRTGGRAISYQHDITKSFAVSGRFIGTVGEWGSETMSRQTSLTTPTGTRGCPCDFTDLAGVDGSPGSYTIRIDSAGVEPGWDALPLAGVDVLPPG